MQHAAPRPDRPQKHSSARHAVQGLLWFNLPSWLAGGSSLIRRVGVLAVLRAALWFTLPWPIPHTNITNVGPIPLRVPS